MKQAPASGARRRLAAGFTLMELLVTIAIAAILLAVGVPALSNATLGSTLSGTANSLFATVRLARSEAIKRNARVVLCVSSDGQTCAGSGGWEQGWILFHDANSNSARSSDETLIQHQQAASTGIKITETGGTALTVTFPPIGTLNPAREFSFKVCRYSPDPGSQERKVVVTAMGQARVEKTTEGTCT